MANPLTGDYEAVAQIAIRQINGLLGTLHQNSGQDAALKLLHSTTMRVGDPRRKHPEVGVFGDWLVDYQNAAPGRGLDDLRAQLTFTAPPGAARTFEDAFAGFDQDWVIQLPPDVVRGTVKLQTSSVTVSVPNGSSSEVTIHAHVRAQYYPDPDTTELPQPVHGEVDATFDVRKAPHAGGRRLVIKPSTQDAKIQFIAAPGSGLTGTDQSRISSEVRKLLREGLILLPIDLPADFMFNDFKGLGSGANQVIALPFQLSGAALPPNGLQSLTQSFIGSNGFGFAVSKELVNALIDLEAIQQAIRNRPPLVLKLSRWGVSVSVTYRLRFSSGPTLTFKNGGIEIAGRVEAETDTVWAPNGFVRFKQLVTLVLDPASQVILLQRVGEPNVDESWFIPHGTAVNIVRSEVDKALAENGTVLSRTFDDARGKLIQGLRTFDAAALATYTTIQVTTDGVIVGGEIRSLARQVPIVQIGETHQGAAFTAFQGWIPAGRIDRFVWTWVEHPAFAAIWSGVTKTEVDEHRFVLPKPAGVANLSQICLRLEGTQIMPSGQEVSVAAGTTCQVSQPDIALAIPSWWEPLTIPFWKPNRAETGTLRDAIAGHMSVQADFTPDNQRLRNALVYFVDDRRDRTLDALIEALGRTRNASSIVTTVVLPAGTFDTSRREIERRFGLPREGVHPLHFTEDDEGGWTRTFGVTTYPSMYLINARREFVWKHEGEPDAAAVAAALDEYVVPTGPSRFNPLRLTVSPGDAAPDALFEDGADHYALHRLRGREVFLNFWQAWSAPCLTELQRLQHLHNGGREAPFIVGFHGGAKTEAVDDVRGRLGLSYPLVQDSQQQMARKYGVRCWPTTIKIDPNGRVEHIQFGTAQEHEHPPGSNELQAGIGTAGL